MVAAEAADRMSGSPSSGKERREARRQATLAADKVRVQNAQRKRLAIMVSVVLVIAVAAVTILVALNGADDGNADLSNPSIADSTAIYQGLVSQGMTLGDANAPVTVIEYADYQCPFCQRFTLNVEPQLLADFVKTGKVKFEFRPMPILSSLELADKGNESVRAAEATMCAMDQGKFWDFHHVLFLKQDGENKGTFSDVNLISYATETGLDVPTFTTCLSTGKYQQAVIDSRTQGIADGVTSTPSFVINGTRVLLTTQGYDRLKQQIQAAVDGKPIP